MCEESLYFSVIISWMMLQLGQLHHLQGPDCLITEHMRIVLLGPGEMLWF